jgi:zinc protease
MRRNTPASVAAALLLAALLAAPAAAQVESWKDIKFPPLPRFDIPKPEEYTLQNGMTVFLLEDHELPLVKVYARVRTGAKYDPADKVGLAELMADVERTGGTARMTGDQVDDFLAARAASVETDMSDDSGSASMECLKGDFGDVFRVFADILRVPVFAEDRLEVAKAQATTEIARRNDNVNAIARREFERLIYGPESPYVRMEEYTTIAAITRDDLLAFHAEYYHPNNIMIGVVGDFQPGQMRKEIQDVFGDWARGPKLDLPEVPYRTSPRPVVFFIEKSDVNQANIAMGHLGIEVSNPDYFAVQVLNEVLGGGFASRLFSNVRSKKGLAYSVYGGVGASFTHPGVFRVGLQTKSQSMAQAVDALEEEVRGIIANPPSEEELKRAKESILNSFVFNYDSRAKILSQQMLYAYYGLPADFLDTYRADIEKVTTADTARVAKRYIHPEQMAILVVGNDKDFDKPLATFGTVNTVDITIPSPPETAPKVEKTAEGLARGRTLLATVARTMGGEKAGEAKAIQSSGSITVSIGGQSMSLHQKVLLVFPDKIRQEMQTPMGAQVVVLDGKEGFMKVGGQVKPLPGPMVEKEHADLARDLRFIVRYHADPEMEAVAGGEKEVDGTTCTVLAVTYHGTSSRLCVAEDGRVLTQTYQGTNPLTRAPGEVEITYSDYRAEGGLEVPHTTVMRVDGQDVMKTTLESFEVNPQVDPAAFEKPAA